MFFNIYTKENVCHLFIKTNFSIETLEIRSITILEKRETFSEEFLSSYRFFVKKTSKRKIGSRIFIL